MARNAQRRQGVGQEAMRIAEERSDQAPVRARVAGQLGHGLVDREAQEDRRLAVERVGHRGARPEPGEAVLRQRQAAEPGRQDPERVHRRAHVVQEAGQRELGRAAAATRLVGRLQHQDRGAGLRQVDRRRQPVGTGADDHRVRIAHAVGSYAGRYLSASGAATMPPPAMVKRS